jgi:hypothetical protein
MERDIVIIDCRALADCVTYYRCCANGGPQPGMDETLSWRDVVAPRLAEQAAGFGAERAMLVLLWNGSNHFDALVLESSMPREERDAMARAVRESVMVLL